MKAMKDFVLCLSPFAPHICEELWQILGESGSIVFASYPEYDETKTIKQEIELVVQVNSKIRGKINLPADLEQKEYEDLAKKDEKVIKHWKA